MSPRSAHPPVAELPLTIRPLLSADGSRARRVHTELAAEGFHFLLHFEPSMDFADYAGDLVRLERGEDIPEGFVPSSFRVAALAAPSTEPPAPSGTIVGRVSIRHELNAWLARRGGHIGFGVRPAFRGRGIAGALLAYALDHLSGLGVPDALVTADEDNLASRRVIERAGGMLDDIDRSEPGTGVARYWISTTRVPPTPSDTPEPGPDPAGRPPLG